MKLINPTKKQLNAAFAEKVAGWLAALHREGMPLALTVDAEGWR